MPNPYLNLQSAGAELTWVDHVTTLDRADTHERHVVVGALSSGTLTLEISLDDSTWYSHTQISASDAIGGEYALTVQLAAPYMRLVRTHSGTTARHYCYGELVLGRAA